MQIGIIGTGAIGSFVLRELTQRGLALRALLVRPSRVAEMTERHPEMVCVSTVSDLPDNVDLIIDCAGQQALKDYGSDILRRGIDLVTVSIGALADPALYDDLQAAAKAGRATLHLASGAIGALDALRAARTGSLESVTYVGRKPPDGWEGSPAEEQLDLENMGSTAVTHFSGSARDAALTYPKNANVAAAVALAGLGLDETDVQLIADPTIDQNVHEVVAKGDFGAFSFEIRGNALPHNPRSSALAAMSAVATVAQLAQPLRF